MRAALPADLPESLKTQVLDGSWSAAEAEEGGGVWVDGILEAKMKGVRAVFIMLVPMMAVCLLGCVWVPDRVLRGDEGERDGVRGRGRGAEGRDA